MRDPLIVYSSCTGNTKKVAEAIARLFPGVVPTPVRNAPDPYAYNIIVLGFWVRRGKPDPASLAYMDKLEGKKIVLFGTLGAWPDSDHARRCADFAGRFLEDKGNTVPGVFLCQGRINPKMWDALPERVKLTHPMTEERKRRHAAAASHPDAADEENAQAFVRSCLGL